MRKSTTVSPEEFVKAWQQSNSLDEVAKAVGISKVSAYQRAHGYRRKGVPLKKYPRNFGEKINYALLAKVARAALK